MYGHWTPPPPPPEEAAGTCRSLRDGGARSGRKEGRSGRISSAAEAGKFISGRRERSWIKNGQKEGWLQELRSQGFTVSFFFGKLAASRVDSVVNQKNQKKKRNWRAGDSIAMSL